MSAISPARFATLIAATFGLLLALNLVAVTLLLGTDSSASSSRCANIEHRVVLAQDAPSPKMMIIGGSGTRRGINAEQLSEELGVRAQNFGLHAGIGIGFILDKARQVLEPGDAALLVLEYNFYAENRPTDVAIDTWFGCGRDYVLAQSADVMFETVAGLSIIKIFDRIGHRFFADKQARQGPGAQSTEWSDMPLSDKAFPRSGAASLQRLEGFKPINIRLQAGNSGPKAIRDFIAWAEENNIEVLATWPNTIDFDVYDDAPAIDQIKAFYRNLGVSIVGEPDIALFPASAFYDTQYHLDRPGIIKRTSLLAAAFKQNSAFRDWRSASAKRPAVDGLQIAP